MKRVMYPTPNSRLGSLSPAANRCRVESVVYDMSEELPHDLLLAISRILDLEESPETDPLDTIGGQFNVIDIINRYFPDGAFVLEALLTELPKPPSYFFRTITWTTRCCTGSANAR